MSQASEVRIRANAAVNGAWTPVRPLSPPSLGAAPASSVSARADKTSGSPGPRTELSTPVASCGQTGTHPRATARCPPRTRPDTLCGVRVLVIGSGAREHALVLAASGDPAVTALACAPGNAGTAAVAEQLGVEAADPEAVAALAKSWQADLVVVGPEVPLVAGVADAVRKAGIACFGPSAAAARIEGSKAFAKDVMAAANVPTARSEVVDNPARLDAALARFGPTWVVKDDGLAAGKGVVVTADLAAARTHAMTLLEGGHPVLLESFLDGPEASLFCVVDGHTVVPLLPAQDFKRVGDDDAGPNTGGMGAYAPLPWAPENLVDELVEKV